MAQVLIVDALDRELESMLARTNLRVKSVASSALTTFAHASAQCPDVLVVDVRGGRPVPAALGAVKRQHARVSILIVASTLDPAVMLEAMRAGANEVVAEPLTVEAIEAILRDGLPGAMNEYNRRQ